MNHYNDVIEIDTPENVALEAEIAGFGSRCVAAMIDYLIIFVMMSTFSCLFAQAAGGVDSGTTALVIWLLVLFFIFMFYHLAFEFLLNGQTPGKRYVKIRVVQDNGLPATTSGLLIRNFVRIFDFLPMFYGFGLVGLFMSKHTQRLGDMAGRTLVIHERPVITLKNLKEHQAVVYYFVNTGGALPVYIDTAKLTAADRQVAVDYLQRRAHIEQREYVVVPLAQRIAERMGVAQLIMLASPYAAEEFVEQVALAFERHEQSADLPWFQPF